MSAPNEATSAVHFPWHRKPQGLTDHHVSSKSQRSRPAMPVRMLSHAAVHAAASRTAFGRAYGCDFGSVVCQERTNCALRTVAAAACSFGSWDCVGFKLQTAGT